MLSYSVNATTAAPPAAVWRLLLDARTWPVWSAVDSLDAERSSGLDPDGRDQVGAVRAFRTGKTVTGERLTGLVEEKQLTYEDAFNKALHDYRAVIDLTPAGGGTAIHWHGTYAAGWATGLLLRRVMPRIMQQMANGLAAHAERPAPE
ncbi:SRPBCC family protein [Amycolatopsis sp. NBC_00345]|uniref:SRPBCC family protein n=1 Tax=Amycolatopsis sp. NBC_00345 TaxID=2975955 RepID=UPI002E2608FF